MEKKQVPNVLKQMTAGEILGWAMGMGLFIVVLGFLAIHSLNAFYFIFKDSQEYLAPLGFGMTGGAMLVYLVKLVNSSNASNLKKTIYFVMLFVCGVGEVLTALFGMKLGAANTGQYVLPQGTVDTFFLLVQGLAFCHFLAIVGEFAGDIIADMFSNIRLPFFGSKENDANPVQATAMASDAPKVLLSGNGEHAETAANFTEGRK
jgi:hypothetical protein